jgi:hypothetical protein
MKNKQNNKDHIFTYSNFNNINNFKKANKNLDSMNNILTIDSLSKKLNEENSSIKFSIENSNKITHINKDVNKYSKGKKKFFKNSEELKKHFSKSIDIGNFKTLENWPKPPIDYRYLDKNGNSKKKNLIKPIILKRGIIKYYFILLLFLFNR